MESWKRIRRPKIPRYQQYRYHKIEYVTIYSYYSFGRIKIRTSSPWDVAANILICDIVVSEFEFLLCNYDHFWTNTLGSLRLSIHGLNNNTTVLQARRFWSYIEQILEAASHKTAAVRSPTFHHEQDTRDTAREVRLSPLHGRAGAGRPVRTDI